MKSICKWGLLIVFLISYQTTEAQLFKKLKNKVEKKLERKAEEKLDKEIDKTIDDMTSEQKKEKMSKKKPKDRQTETIQNEISKNEDFGDAIITHSNSFGGVQISEVGKIKVTQSKTQWTFNGSWWSHEVDVHDGFFLTVLTEDNLRHDAKTDTENIKRTFKIPEEATLKLSYDPDLPYYVDSDDDFKRGVSDNYQTYDVSKGEVTIDVLKEGAIQVAFKGKVTLRKVIRQQANPEEYTEEYYESTINGAVDGTNVEYFNNTSFNNTPKEDITQSNPANTSNTSNTTTETATPGIYQFTYETIVKVTSLDDNKTYNMSYLLNPNTKYMGIKVDMSEYSDEEMAGETIMVMDNKSTHIFVEAQGMKMQMSQSMMGGNQVQNPTDQMANYDYSNVTTTGQTKTILGATCYEYIMQDANIKMTLWVAPSIDLPNWFVQNNEVLKGYIMEYTINSNDGNMKSEVTAINDNINRTINPKAYRKMF